MRVKLEVVGDVSPKLLAGFKGCAMSVKDHLQEVNLFSLSVEEEE